MTVSRQRAVPIYVPLLAARVRVFGSHLDRFVARDELYKTHGLHSHVVDGRRLQVVRGVRLRKTEAFSQISAHLKLRLVGCATSVIEVFVAHSVFETAQKFASTLWELHTPCVERTGSAECTDRRLTT